MTASHSHHKPMFRGFIHMLAFSSALTLAPILIVITPGVTARFVMAIYGLSIVGDPERHWYDLGHDGEGNRGRAHRRPPRKQP